MKNSSEQNPILLENQAFGLSSSCFDFDIQGQLEISPDDHTKVVLNGIGRANYREMIYEGQFV
jgi:hypothetical protein